jgi:hypothetical protein
MIADIELFHVLERMGDKCTTPQEVRDALLSCGFFMRNPVLFHQRDLSDDAVYLIRVKWGPRGYRHQVGHWVVLHGNTILDPGCSGVWRLEDYLCAINGAPRAAYKVVRNKYWS